MSNYLDAPLPKITRPKTATISILGEDAKRIIKQYVQEEIGLKVEFISFNADERDMLVRVVDIKVNLEEKLYVA